MDKDETIILEIPDKKNIHCLTCFWGQHNFLASYCVKYKSKSKEVYFKNAKCPNYKPINAEEIVNDK